MKKFLVLFLIFICCFSAVACNKSVEADYPNAAEFEAALNNGDDLTGKTVTFTVREVKPNSILGYNLIAGEHLNFCSDKNPGVKSGDTITVKVEEVSSLLGSYIIHYQKVS